MTWKSCGSKKMNQPLIIRGKPFTFRTLHAPDGRRMNGECTLDKIMTVTLPAIDGFHHKAPADTEVVL
jgi:hypothetical protein